MQKLARSLRKPRRHRLRSIAYGFERVLAPLLTQGHWLLRRWRPSGRLLPYGRWPKQTERDTPSDAAKPSRGLVAVGCRCFA
jgi:hypothetical protein